MTKRILSLLLCVVLAFSMTACGDTGSGRETEKQSGTGSQEAGTKTEGQKESVTDGKKLVVYFSVPETTKADNMNSEEENSTVVVDGEVLGNTQYVANVIQNNTGADIFRIEPETPYPMDHAELEEVATKEAEDEAYPAIAKKVENIEQYDTIFVGYPNWYADMPRILYSFFKDYDFAGKTIVPFVTSGGSGFSDTISTIADLEPDAKVVEDGYSVTRDVVQDAEDEITAWLKELGY